MSVENDGSLIALALHAHAFSLNQGLEPIWQFQDLSQVQIAAMEQRTEEYLQRAILAQVDERLWGRYYSTPERCLSIILDEFALACWHPLSARELPEDLLEMHEGRLPGHAEYAPSFCRVCQATLLLKPPIVPRRCRNCSGSGEVYETVLPDFSSMDLLKEPSLEEDLSMMRLPEVRRVACRYCGGYGRIGEQQEKKEQQHA